MRWYAVFNFYVVKFFIWLLFCNICAKDQRKPTSSCPKWKIKCYNSISSLLTILCIKRSYSAQVQCKQVGSKVLNNKRSTFFSHKIENVFTVKITEAKDTSVANCWETSVDSLWYFFFNLVPYIENKKIIKYLSIDWVLECCLLYSLPYIYK